MPSIASAFEWDSTISLLCLVSERERYRSQRLQEKARQTRHQSALFRASRCAKTDRPRVFAASPSTNWISPQQQARQLRQASQRLRARAAAIRKVSARLRKRCKVKRVLAEEAGCLVW